MIKQLKARVAKVSMRDVIALAQAPTPDKVSGFNFRSEDEVQVFLEQLNEQLEKLTKNLPNLQKLFAKAEETAAGPITINRGGDKTTAPSPFEDTIGVGKITIHNMGKLRDQFDLVVELQHKLEVLDSLEVQTQNLFRGERGNKIPGMLKKTKQDYEKKLKLALNFLKVVAKKHEPKAFANLVKNVLNYFHESFKNKFKAAEEHIFVTPKTISGADGKEHQILVFNHYIAFADLVNEHMDYTYPQYIIVFTAMINDKGSMRMFVNTLHKFRAPGSFKPGSEFKDLKSGVNALSHLFEVDDFIDLLERQPMPISKDRMTPALFRAKDVIKNVDVKDNVIQVLFNSKVNRENIQDVAKQVLLDIRGMFEQNMKTNIRYQIIKPAKGMQFILTKPSNYDSSKFMTPEQIDHIQNYLGLDDDEAAKFVQLFNKGHN